MTNDPVAMALRKAASDGDWDHRVVSDLQHAATVPMNLRCGRCDGTGNQLMFMYQRCINCNGTGQRPLAPFAWAGIPLTRTSGGPEVTYRYNVEILASGQTGPYQDSRRHVRLTIDCMQAWLGDPKDPRSKWVPNETWTEEEIRKLLPHLRCGFTENTDYRLGSSRLDWLKQVSPGVWEFHTTEPFND